MKQLSLLLILISALALSGCTRKEEETTRISFSLPAVNQSVSASVSSQSAGWNSGLNPTSLDDINCYGVLVSGPDELMQKKSCQKKDLSSFKVGAWGGLYTGGKISLEVPAGPKREIIIVGFRANAGFCGDIAKLEKSELSYPHILAKQVEDLSPGDANISIAVSLKTGDDYQIEDCPGLTDDDAGTGTTTTTTTVSSTTTTLLANTVYFNTSSSTVAESSGAINIAVDSSLAAAANIVIPYTVSGSATSGDDFTALSGTVTILQGQTTASLSVPLINDTLDEADETLILTLGTPSGATVGATGVYTITLTDDDAAPVISVANISQSESSTTMTFTVSMSPVSGQDVTFNYSTSNGTATSGIDYTPSSGGGTILAGQSSATFNVSIMDDYDTEVSETLYFTISAPTNATLGSSVGTGTITDADYLLPVAKYPSAGNWNDYVLKSNTAVMCSGSENLRAGGCVHGGERRAVSITGEVSCSNLAMIDNLQFFDWKCDGTQNPIVFYGMLKKNKGLRDLIDNFGWKSNKVELRRSGILIRYSEMNAWWSNQVAAATVDPTVVQNLNQAGKIYWINTNISSAGYNIGANKVSLVTLGSNKITRSSSMPTANCDPSTAGITGSGSNTCMIAASAKQFLWIEANVDARFNSAYSSYGLFLYGSKFVRVHNSDFSGAVIGVNFSYNNSSTMSNVRIFQNGNGIKLSQSNENLFTDINVTTNQTAYGSGVGTGIWLLNNSSKNHFVGYSVTNNGETGLAVGDYPGPDTATADNLFVNGLLASNETDSIWVNSPRSTFLNTTVANSLLNNIVINGTAGTTVVNTLAANPGSANSNLEANTATATKIYDFFAKGGGIGLNNVASTIVVDGVLRLESASNCAVSGGGVGFTGICVGIAGNYAAHTFGNFLVGKVMTNDPVNTSSATSGLTGATITDWINFSSIFRFFGEEGTTFPNVSNTGSCGSFCRVWDMTLSSANVTVRNFYGAYPAVNLPPLPCPASASDALTDGQSPPNTFLTHATEIMGDNVGDDNGLCQSNEACLFSPNPGVYQGQGEPHECAYSGGSVLNVKMFGHPVNGN